MADVTIRQRFAEITVREGLEPVRQRIEQDAIYVGDKCVGYVGTQLESPLTLLHAVSDSTLAAIKQAVEERDRGLGRPAYDDRAVNVAPSMAEVRKAKR